MEVDLISIDNLGDEFSKLEVSAPENFENGQLFEDLIQKILAQVLKWI